MVDDFDRRLYRLEHYYVDLQWWLGRVDRDIEDIGRRMAGVEQTQQEHTGQFRAIDAKLKEHDARFDTVDAKLRAHDARFDAVETRLQEHDGRFDSVDIQLRSLTQMVGTVLERLDHGGSSG